MYEYGHKLIVTNDIDYTDKYEKKTFFKKGTILFFVDIYEENTDKEEWKLSPIAEQYNTFFLPASVAKQNIKDYLEYYQEQFSHLNPEYVYFGQLYETSKFIMVENGENVLYEKIGEYVNSEGLKYNAVRMPTFSHDNYWVVDDINTYKNKTFAYFDQDHKTENDKRWDNKVFIPPKPLAVNDYFVQFPSMLKVLEYAFEKTELPEDLLTVYEKYKKYKFQKSESWQEPEDIPITQVLELVAQKQKEDHDANIMAEINRETEQFRQSLIKKRFK